MSDADKVIVYERVLTELVSWTEGAEVTGEFDEPFAALVARAALRFCQRSQPLGEGV